LGRHFDREIIVLCVRLRFKLSSRHLAKMMAERNPPMAYITIMRWVYHFAPEFERRWNRFGQLRDMASRCRAVREIATPRFTGLMAQSPSRLPAAKKARPSGRRYSPRVRSSTNW
jgi:hypothetical protein